MHHITEFQLVRNSLVRECLVDMADRDYLAARVSWRTRLPEQFLWSALQSIEKQLKAIIVLNELSAKGIGHDIERALRVACEIQDLRLNPPEVIKTFVKYLNRHGPNRYLERPFYLRGHELFELDRAFWHFRRYCQDFRATARYLKKTEDEYLAMHEKWFTDPQHKKRPYLFRLFNGYLEKVLDGKNGPEQYKALVWKNVYYGKRDKGTIQYAPVSWIANPAHVRHPKHFKKLAEIMDFPKDVRRSFDP